ncbi:MAG: MraY family glycosyltransferase [Bacteroidota bacterium]
MELDFIAFVLSFCVVVYFTPVLIKVAIFKNLIDKPDKERKFHEGEIPTIGGIMIFAATIIGYGICFPSPYIEKFNFLLSSIMIMFFVGIKDDIIGTTPLKKLAAHFLAALIMVVLADVRIKGFHGIFDIQEIPEGLSILLSLFTIIVVVNAYNLIDGVDGLAAGVGLLGCIVFGVWFLLSGNSVESCLAFSLGGALLGFLGFNFSPARIFMGDSGSLTIGIVMAFLSIQLIEYEKSYYLMPPLDAISKPALVIAALFYPLTDTMRVFIIRISERRSPFSADRNHIHHKLLDAGFNHKKTVMIIYLITLISILTAFFSRGLNPSFSLFAVIAIPMISLQFPYYSKTKRFLF